MVWSGARREEVAVLDLGDVEAGARHHQDPVTRPKLLPFGVNVPGAWLPVVVEPVIAVPARPQPEPPDGLPGRHDSRPDGPTSFIRLPGGGMAVGTMVTSGGDHSHSSRPGCARWHNGRSAVSGRWPTDPGPRQDPRSISPTTSRERGSEQRALDSSGMLLGETRGVREHPLLSVWPSASVTSGTDRLMLLARARPGPRDAPAACLPGRSCG